MKVLISKKSDNVLAANMVTSTLLTTASSHGLSPSTSVWPSINPDDVQMIDNSTDKKPYQVVSGLSDLITS